MNELLNTIKSMTNEQTTTDWREDDWMEKRRQEGYIITERYVRMEEERQRKEEREWRTKENERRERELMMRRKRYEEMKKKPKVTFEEFDCLERWSGKECGEIVFDSKKECWKQDKSVFHRLLGGRCHLVFLIENKENERFGMYLNTRIEEKCDVLMSTDDQSFHFSLVSNVLKEPMRFEVRNKKRG